MKIKSNGIELHVEDRGTGGPSLLFLHYWGGSSRTWRHVVSALSADFRTVTIDQRGWGQSDDAPSYTLADLADDAQAVIGALGLDWYVLIGHSMGGKAAQLLASRQPQGLQGLVLVAPSPPSPLGLPLEVRQGMVGAYTSPESVIATVNQVLAGNPLGQDDLACVVEDSMRGASAAKAAWPLETSQEDISAEVANISVPVLVISGEDDRVDPPSVLRQELLPRLRHVELKVLPGIGHLSPLEAPSELANLIKSFVQKVVA
jgi:pimeloyl-ACP methyl ester carboxylesterase